MDKEERGERKWIKKRKEIEKKERGGRVKQERTQRTKHNRGK